MTITVLVADDQAMVRAGFAAVLDAQPGIEVVGQASDGAEAVRLAHELRPDVIVMDVRMPGTNGIEATRALQTPPRSSDYVPRVLMLTTFDIDEYVYQALRAGASGFLLKDALPDEVARAVRVIAAGEALLAPSVTRRLIEDVAKQAPARPVDEHLLSALTEREREVLVRIARGRSNQEIAAELFIAEQTVKTHVSKILQKLGLRDRVHAVVFAYDTGLVSPAR
ncbi:MULTISPECIES: response regulator transcription factor [Agromyces]|uniref:DNA-binding response regulator n=1 Tax=Agromyces mediolanus TaxID=41986 RepID=A0A918FEM4_AGRME|nr:MULTISPECIES: response regulator transcription factor [Agromyces]MCD1570840.1 response regulator transcription factor [Agromyces mediolanus]GGR30372.1 DNA-binding response regulator [Agromyces mediolanus]GLU91091.1 DNA-binding response regulator [Agromyces sp. NBRC 114283]